MTNLQISAFEGSAQRLKEAQESKEKYIFRHIEGGDDHGLKSIPAKDLTCSITDEGYITYHQSKFGGERPMIYRESSLQNIEGEKAFLEKTVLYFELKGETFECKKPSLDENGECDIFIEECGGGTQMTFNLLFCDDEWGYDPDNSRDNNYDVSHKEMYEFLNKNDIFNQRNIKQ